MDSLPQMYVNRLFSFLRGAYTFLPLQLHCEVCQKKDRGEQMLLCDGCDCGTSCGSIFESSSISLIVNVTLGFHTFCLDPPLSTIPKGQWFCHVCLFGTGGDFGFDEGEEHSLSSFQARDTEFRQQWFKMHPPGNGDSDHPRRYNPLDPAVNRFGDVLVSETDVETEFWRLVQSTNETVEVEYGADVHSTTHGRSVQFPRFLGTSFADVSHRHTLVACPLWKRIH